MAEISDLISGLQKSGLDAECPECGESSALSDWLLFDGLKSFPTDAEQKKQEMEEALQTDLDKLKKAKERIKELQIRLAEALEIDEAHQKQMGKLQTRLTDIEEDNKKLAHQVEDLKLNHVRKSGL